MRNEKPQRGRNREFWQLNCDIFGSASLKADIETLQLALDIMLEFDPPQDSFVLALNNRKLIDAILELSGAGRLRPEDRIFVIRTLDKWDKLSEAEVNKRLSEAGLDKAAILILQRFMMSESLERLIAALPELEKNEGFMELSEAMNILSELGYGEWIEFRPTIIRGFDYYDGLVFEVFDRNPENKRALFGGGRYNGLAEIFGEKNFPAVGFAPGDETTRLFLESWGLLGKAAEFEEKSYYLPLLSKKLELETAKLAKRLRIGGGEGERGLNILAGLEEQKIGKALEFADKRQISQVIIFGEDEAARGVYKIKDMRSGEEKEEKV